MSRDTYDVVEEYLGTGSVSAYTFDFKIEALAQLEVVEIDDTGAETQRVRGTDVTYLSSVDYDAIEGGGTVNLAANLTAGYTLLILLANDEPTQPYRFRNKGSFTLKRIEAALDYVLGPIQRLAYLITQTLRIHDIDADGSYDMQLPPMPTDPEGRFIRINDAGDGFIQGENLKEIKKYVLPDGTITGQVQAWDGSNWGAALRGGGMYVSATQNIAAGGNITVNAAIQQLLKVQGNAAAVTTSIAPFTGTLVDGMIITLLGMNTSNYVKVPYSNTVDGCILKGDWYGEAGSTLTLVYSVSDRRFYEIARNY